jgi:ubiquinone/menaquinone biosynthesis C-methylase UbiE
MNLFSDLASGYANARPPVHPRIIERARQRFEQTSFGNALDIGCGAGLSTRALAPIATHAIGLEPAESMLRQAARSGASYVVGRGEGLPFANRSIDLMTAAGSLNYADDLGAFFAEARRVMKESGALLVYDFSPGRNAALQDWFGEFMTRYPRAQDNARFLDPAILQAEASTQFRLSWHENFQIPIALGQDFYVDYMMTETNVASAIQRGADTAPEIRAWITETLDPIFAQNPQEIVFEGYLACLQ